jgi:hypothetical protein
MVAFLWFSQANSQASSTTTARLTKRGKIVHSPASSPQAAVVSSIGQAACANNRIYPYLLRGLEVYVRAYDSVDEARASLSRYIHFYNGAIGLIRALTDARPIKPTSTRCLFAQRPNPGRGAAYRTRKFCSDNRSHLTA